MLNIETITNDCQFRATLGYGMLEFKVLLSELVIYYQEKNNQSYEDYIRYLKQNISEEKHSKLDTLEKVLSLVLYQMKNGATYDVLGVIFEISGTVARCYFDKYSTLIDELLEKKIKTSKRI
jgi:phosphomannomutase